MLCKAFNKGVIMKKNKIYVNLTNYLILIIFATGVSIYAKTTTWDGSTGNWNESHWDEGIPESGDEVIINSGTVTISNATPALTSYTQGGGTLLFTNWMTKLEAETITLNPSFFLNR